MKKTRWYASLLACMGILFAGCSEQNMGDSFLGISSEVTLQGSIENNTVSRSAVTDEGVFSWLEGDEIMVELSNGGFQVFRLSDGAGTGNGSFTANLEKGVTIANGARAISPATLFRGIDDNDNLVMFMRPEYDWQPGQTNAMMFGIVNDGQLSFQNIGGLVKLSINNIKDDCDVVVTSSTHQLFGEMSITKSDNGYVLQAQSLDENTEEIRPLVFYSRSNESKQAFYLPLPVAEGMKLNVRVFENDVLKLEKKTTLNIKRNQLILMPTLTLPENANAVVEDVTSASDVNEALAAAGEEGNQEVVITVNSNNNENAEPSPVIEVAEPIVIPTSITTAEGKSVNITFDEVPVGTVSDRVILTDYQGENVESTESKSCLTVAIPEITGDVEAPSFDIDLPSTTVTLGATQETASYGTVWAKTANNTLIVAQGVTVNNLLALQGSIEISGIVENLERSKAHGYGNEKTKVVIKEGGILKNVMNADTDFQIILEDNEQETNNVFVSDFAELEQALMLNNVNILVENDFDLTSPFKINRGQEVNIDLQGHTLSINLPEGYTNPETSGAKAFITNRGNLTISDGTLNGRRVADSNFWRFILNEDADGFSLSGVTVNNYTFKWGITIIYTDAVIDNGTVINAKNVHTAFELAACNLNIQDIELYGNITLHENVNLSIKDGYISGRLMKDNGENCTIHVSENVEIRDETGSWSNDGNGDYSGEFNGTVNTFEELQNALKHEGGLIRLGQDITITAPLTINGNFTFKMQFHTLSVSEKLEGSKAVIINKGQLCLSIGDLEGPATSVIKYFIWNEPESTLILHGANVRANGIYAGVLLEKATCLIESFDNETHSSIVAPNLAINNGGGIVAMKNGTIEGLVMNQSGGSIEVNAGTITGDLESNDPAATENIQPGVVVNGKGWPSSSGNENEGGDGEEPDYSGEFNGYVKNYKELVEALKYKKSEIHVLQSFDITGPLTITGEAFLYMGKSDTLTIAESVNNVAFTNYGRFIINASGGKIINKSSQCMINNLPNAEFYLYPVDITSSSSKYDIWNEGNFMIFSGDEFTTSLKINEFFNTGGSLRIIKANIIGNFMNQQSGNMTIEAGSITGNLTFPETSLGNQFANITINKGVVVNGEGWDDDRIKWN